MDEYVTKAYQFGPLYSTIFRLDVFWKTFSSLANNLKVPDDCVLCLQVRHKFIEQHSICVLSDLTARFQDIIKIQSTIPHKPSPQV